MRILCLLLLGCGGPVQWLDDGRVQADLVERWRPERVLVEVEIDGKRPVLMQVDPGTPGIEVAMRYARRLGLPTDRTQVEGRLLQVGRHLAEVELTLVEAAPDPFHNRAVVGTLGRALFKDRVLAVDPGAGTLAIQDHGTYGQALDEWALPVEFGEHTVPLQLSWRRNIGRIVSDQAAPAGLVMIPGPAGPAAWSGPARVVGQPPRPLAFAAADRNLTGLALFQDLLVRVDWRAAPKLSLEPTQHVAPLRCALATACISGTVEQVEPGRLTLLFTAPDPLPPNIWQRVAYGPNQTHSVLVRLNPRHDPLRATVKVPPLTPAYLPRPGDPLTVVDEVELAAPCKADVCLRDPRVHPLFEPPADSPRARRGGIYDVVLVSNPTRPIKER